MHKRVVCTCAMSLPCIILWRTIRLRVQFVRDHLLPPLSLFHSLQTQYAERESWGSSWWAQFYTSWRCQIPRIRRGCRYTIDGRLALMMKTRVNCRWPRGLYIEDGARQESLLVTAMQAGPSHLCEVGGGWGQVKWTFWPVGSPALNCAS